MCGGLRSWIVFLAPLTLTATTQAQGLPPVVLHSVDEGPADAIGADVVAGHQDVGCPAGSFFFTGEVLFLHPTRDGLETAIVSQSANGVTGSSLEALSWDATTGFR